MKILYNISKKMLAFVCILLAAMVISGCKNKNDDKKDPDVIPEKVVITISAETDQIRYNEEVALTVTVEGSKNTKYTLTVKEGTKEIDYAVVENDKLKIVKEVAIDKFITVTATSVAQPTATASKTFTVKAPVIEGQVGELTSDLISQIANPNITFTGVITDIYRDLNNSRNNSEEKYEMTVKMEEDKWYGEWNHFNTPESKTSDFYFKGDKDGVRDQYGNVGHTMEYEFVNKNNEIEVDYVKDYISVPAVWEGQHLWNHLGQLNVNKFEYDAENQVYKYKASTTEDLYLLTYFSISLTPLLGPDETLVDFYLVIEGGKITQILGQTVVLYNGSTDVDPKDADTMEYTTVALQISDIGATKIERIKAYEAPEHADLLANAFTNMGTLTNYTYEALETYTKSPSYDNDDYEIQSVQTKSVKRAIGLHNYTSSTGKEGIYGQITEDAVMIEKTGKYYATMDGKDYHIEYSGYKKINDNTYDYFEFNSKKTIELNETVFEGTRQYQGSFFDRLPKFDISANIFEFVSEVNKNGQKCYKFKLRSELIARDVALAISAHTNARDAERDNQISFTVTVDDQGHVIESLYPFNISSGVYRGYIKTTYSNFGTTVIEEGSFDNYIPREIKNDWSKYDVKYYHPTFTTNYTEEATADVVFKLYLGSDYSNLISPTAFINIFGDNFHGAFYDYKNFGTDDAPDYRQWLQFTTNIEEGDENGQVSEELFLELKEKIDAEMAKEGYKLDYANTDISGGATGRSDYYLCYTKGKVVIVINTNHTRNFWIAIYRAGDWNLKR